MNPSHRYIRQALGALVLLHLSRLHRPLVAMATGMVVLSAIDIIKHGVGVDSILPWVLGGSVMMPLAPVFTLVREKADGSLRYLASLPVSGEQHALARLTVAAIVSVPPALTIAAAVHMTMTAAGFGFSVAAFIGVWLTLTAISLVLLTLQLKAPIGQAATYAIYAMVGFLVLARGVQSAHERGWFDGLLSFASTRAGIVSASALLWTIVGLLGWIAFRAIARDSITYRGEPVEA